MVSNHLLAVMDDYSVDQRGDVGSWSREAAMNAMVTLLQVVWCQEADLNDGVYVPNATICYMVAAILKQSVERIDRTRQCAGEALLATLLVSKKNQTQLLYPHIPHRQELESVVTTWVMLID